LLHTQEVAGSKPAAPTPETDVQRFATGREWTGSHRSPAMALRLPDVLGWVRHALSSPVEKRGRGNGGEPHNGVPQRDEAGRE
jgi:hypothetical protein